jgi:FlaG/FlaF family flagellin (archaellin)
MNNNGRWSWQIIAITALLLNLWSLQTATFAATVTNQFHTPQYLAPEAALRWTMVSAPYVAEDGTIVNNDPFETELDDGFLEATVYAGIYRVSFGRSALATWTIQVPLGEATYAFWYLATNAITSYTNMYRPWVADGTNYPGSGTPIYGTNINGVLHFPRLTGSGISFAWQGATQIQATVTAILSDDN